jgi:hypothetical protein
VEIGKADDHGGAEIADCLRKNGAAVPAGAEGMALKNWIRDHADDAAVKAAMDKCEMGKPASARVPTAGRSSRGPRAGGRPEVRGTRRRTSRSSSSSVRGEASRP